MSYFRSYIYKTETIIDELDISCVDYTIRIINIPLKYTAFNNDYDEDL